jgi:hypothetical protein
MVRNQVTLFAAVTLRGRRPIRTNLSLWRALRRGFGGMAPKNFPEPDVRRFFDRVAHMLATEGEEVRSIILIAAAFNVAPGNHAAGAVGEQDYLIVAGTNVKMPLRGRKNNVLPTVTLTVVFRL